MDAIAAPGAAAAEARCPHCAYPAPAKARECPRCGHGLPHTAANTASLAPALIAGAFVVAALVAAGWRRGK